jgi:hypothetical protein
MAQFAVHGTWKSVAALASLFTLVGLTIFALAGGVPPSAPHTVPLFGLFLYVLCLVVITLGFWSKEDVVAVAGIMALAMLIMLDILFRIGVLGYNGVRVL